MPERQILARDFREWATKGDPTIRDRKILIESQERRSRRKQAAHRWWEFRDSVTVEVTTRGVLAGTLRYQGVPRSCRPACTDDRAPL